MLDGEGECIELNRLLDTGMVITKSGMKLYPAEAVVKILRQLQLYKLFVSGMDCIILHDDGSVQPDMRYDYDFSLATYDSAVNEIQNFDDRYHFELLDDISDVPVYSVKLSIPSYGEGSEWKSDVKKDDEY